MTIAPWYRKRGEVLRGFDEITRGRVPDAGQRLALVRRAQVHNFLPVDARVVWVISGRVRLSVFDDDGAETAWAVLESGECFHPGSRVDEKPPAVAEAIEDVELAVLDDATLRAHEDVAESFQALGIDW